MVEGIVGAITVEEATTVEDGVAGIMEDGVAITTEDGVAGIMEDGVAGIIMEGFMAEGLIEVRFL